MFGREAAPQKHRGGQGRQAQPAPQRRGLDAAERFPGGWIAHLQKLRKTLVRTQWKVSEWKALSQPAPQHPLSSRKGNTFGVEVKAEAGGG